MRRGRVAAGIGTAAAVVVGAVALTQRGAEPLPNLNKLYQDADSCETITLPPGNYPAQEILRDPQKDGKTCRVVFKGEGKVTIATFRTGRSGGSGNTRGADHFELADMNITGTTHIVLADDVVLRNQGDGDVSPQSTKNSFVLGSSTNVQVLGGEYGPWVDGINHISRCGSNPRCPPGGNVLLDGVTLHDFLISNPEPHSECMMLWADDIVGVTIRNTVFRNCTDFGLLVKAARGRNILIENSFFDVPMPGDRDTSACNPDCPRRGSSIRFANSPNGAVPIEPYTGSVVRNNVVNGSIAVDCKCVPSTGNAPGTIPARPPNQPGPPPPPPPTTTVATTAPPPPPTTQPTTTTGPTPPPEFEIHVSAQTATSITFTWTPVPGAIGYRYLKAGKVVSHTWNPTASTVKFGKPGPYAVESLLPGPRAERAS